MRMTNELEQIMKHRLERSADSNGKEESPAFLSPRTAILKKKKAAATATTFTTFVNGGANGNSSSFIPNENIGKDQNDDETIATTATNTTASWNDFNKLSTEETGENQDVFIKKEVIVPTTTPITNGNSNPATQSESIPHNQLKGQARLTSVVKYLEKSCPWTASITPLEMLQWLKSELDEIEKELKLLNAWKEWSEKKSNNVGDDDEIGEEREQRRIAEYECLTNALTSEMGDILFDTVMLEMIIRREYNLKENAAYQTASEKVERRTPYMKEWGDGKTIARTSKEADRVWQDVKKVEKNSPEKSLERSIRAYLEKELGMSELCDEVEFSSTTMNTKLQEIREENESATNGEVQNNFDIQNDELMNYPSDEIGNMLVSDANSGELDRTGNGAIVEQKEYASKTTQVSMSDFSPSSNINNERDNLPPSPNRNPSRINNYSHHNVGIHAALGFAAGSLMMAFIQKCRR